MSSCWNQRILLHGSKAASFGARPIPIENSSFPPINDAQLVRTNFNLCGVVIVNLTINNMLCGHHSRVQKHYYSRNKTKLTNEYTKIVIL